MSFWKKFEDIKNNVGEMTAKTLNMANDLIKNNEFEEAQAQNDSRSPKKQEELKEQTKQTKPRPIEREDTDPLSTSTSTSSKASGSEKPRAKTGAGSNQAAEFKRIIEEKDQLLAQLSDELEVLKAEKQGSQALVEKLQQKLGDIEGSGQMKSGAGEVTGHSPEEFLKRDIVLPKSDDIGGYVQEYMNQYRAEFYSKVIENLNQDILHQLEAEEGFLPDDAREMINLWVKKPETARDTDQLISQDKIIQPLYDESKYRERLEQLATENEKLRKDFDELNSRMPQIEKELEEKNAEYAKYREDTELAYQKYADDIIRYEQDIEDLKEQVSRHNEELKEKNQNLEETQKSHAGYQEQIKELEARIVNEAQQREDAEQRYQVMVDGMKEFEVSIGDLNKENEQLNGEIQRLKNSVKEEKGRVKSFEEYMPISLANGLIGKLNKLNSLNTEVNFGQLMQPKLIIEEERVNIKSFNMALEDTLNVFNGETSKKISMESEEKKNKEKEKYEALSKNAIKLQAELKETRKREREVIAARDQLKEENEDLQQKLTSSASSSTQSTQKISQLQKIITELQDNEKRHMDDINTRKRENEQLKAQISALQDEDTAKNNYVAKLEKELAAIPELSTHMETQTMELRNLQDIIESKTAENEALNQTIVSLQTLVDENQDVQERLLGQYDNEMKKLSKKAEEAERKNRELEENRERFEQMAGQVNTYEEKIKELDLKLRESEQEKNNVRTEAAGIVKKVKSDTIHKENSIDRRMITTFLIKYFDVNASFQVKLQILETLSSILSFSEEERAKIGLHRKRLETHMSKQAENDQSEEESREASEGINLEGTEGTEGTSGAAPNKPKSFTSMFMNFLKE